MRLVYILFWLVFIVLLFVDEYAAFLYVPLSFGIYYYSQLFRLKQLNSLQAFIGLVVFPLFCVFNYVIYLVDFNNILIEVLFGLSEVGLLLWLSYKVVSLIRKESMGLAVPKLLEMLFLFAFPINLFSYKEKLDLIHNKTTVKMKR